MEDEKLKEILSKNLKIARQNMNMTQETLAEKSNISTQFLRDIEGKRKTGSITTLIHICLTLGITPNDLFYEVFKNNLQEGSTILTKINRLSKHDQDIVFMMINNMLEK